MSNRDR